jgi:hypothetical protein
MDDRFTEPLIQGYIAGVLHKGILAEELRRVQGLLILYTKHPSDDKTYQRGLISRTNQLFRALLHAKSQSPKNA